MTDTTRHEILQRLARLSGLAPDMRFGQLIANLAFMAAGPWDETLWDLEDEQLLAAIRQFEADLSQRAADSACHSLDLAVAATAASPVSPSGEQ